jgi:hypothetical protein
MVHLVHRIDAAAIRGRKPPAAKTGIWILEIVEPAGAAAVSKTVRPAG